MSNVIPFISESPVSFSVLLFTTHLLPRYLHYPLLTHSFFSIYIDFPMLKTAQRPFKLPPLGLSKILFLLGEIIIPLLLYYKYKIRPINIMGIINIAIILNVFILINLSQLELSNRLFLYSTFLLPIILCYLFTKIQLGKSILWSIFITFHLLLIMYFNTSMYTYNINFGIIFFPQLFI